MSLMVFQSDLESRVTTFNAFLAFHYFLQPKCFSECSRTMSRESSCRRKYFNYLNSSLSINCSKLWQTIEALWRCWLFSFDWQQQQQRRRRRVVSTFYQILGIIFKTVAKSFVDHPLVTGFLHKLTTWSRSRRD